MKFLWKLRKLNKECVEIKNAWLVFKLFFYILEGKLQQTVLKKLYRNMKTCPYTTHKH